MRTALILTALVALAGCQTVGNALGEYQKAADNGVVLAGSPSSGPVIIGGRPDISYAPAGSVTSGSAPDTPVAGATATAEAASAKPPKPGKPAPLPPGLGGDVEHRAYSDAPRL